ncbi:unnamed protein product, partial [Mesorhabditis spiculigera]
MGSLDESDLLLMAIPHVVLIALSAMILGTTLVKAVDRYDTWFDRHCNCQPNGTTRIASDRLANFSILMFCVYTVIVALMIWARKLSTNWLICVGLLYLADSGTLMMFGRGAQLGCSISYRTDLNQFFNGIAGGQQDMLVSVNLLMAFLRSWEATHLMETMPLWIPFLGAGLCVACGFLTFLLHILEVFGRVWFTPDAQGYHDENKFPVQLLYLCSSYVRSSLCCRLGEVRERAYSTIKMKTLPSPVHV